MRRHMVHEVIEAARWDHPPVRQILIALLAGDAHVLGNLKKELIAAEHAGLIELAPAGQLPVPRQGRQAWHVRPTLVGQNLALRLGSSAELCEVLDCSVAVGREDWDGVEPTQVLRELDLRDGGTGHVPNWRQWGQARGREYVQALPRRLDAGGQPS